VEHLGLTITGVAFWTFLAVSAVAGIVGDYRKRRIELEPLREVLHRGQPLDPAVVDRLMRRETPPKTQLEPLYFRVAGILTGAAGAGLAILAFFVNAVAPIAFYPLLGVGSVSVVVGAGLLICANVIESHRSSKVTPEVRP
jgi:hypothetical protein